MTDLVLHLRAVAHEVVPNKTKQEFCHKLHDGEVLPRPIFTQEVIDHYIEVESGTVAEGDTYNGDGTFSPPPPPPDIWPPSGPGGPKIELLIDKITILERLHKANKLEAYRTKLDAAPILFREKWNAVEKVNPYDQANLAFISSFGADPLVVLDPRKPVVVVKPVE